MGDKTGRPPGGTADTAAMPNEVTGWDPIDVLDTEHADHLRLCDTLEAIADSLPDAIDAELCAASVRALRFDLPVHHEDEEGGLFPILACRALPEDCISEILEQLRAEHATDEGFAAELIDQLEKMARGERPENPDMLGYMLRGFFDGYRRHLNWEQTVLLPLARRRLTKEDLKNLSDWMISNRSGVNRPARQGVCSGNCHAGRPGRLRE